jgi:hypothetical protein
VCSSDLFAIVFWLLAGGVGWKYFFNKECRDNPNANMVHCFCHDVYTFWIHSLIHFLLPQRSGMFSTPLSILIISLLIDLVETAFGHRKSALLAGILMGLLPMLSAHSYIGVGEYAIFACLFAFPFRNKKQWLREVGNWALYGITAIVISLPQILWLMRAHRANFMQMNPIYKKTDRRPVIGFFSVWWDSLGSFLVVTIILVFFVNDRRQNRMYWPAMGVWVISNVVRYQPGAMDNTKVFFAGWYSIACAAAANWLVIVWPRGTSVTKIAIVVTLIGSFFSGTVCIWKGAFCPFTMFSKDERDIGIWVMENTRRDVAVLSGGWHANTLMSLAGKLVTMGYGGWVWTHGLSIDDRKNMMRRMVDNKENPAVFKKFNIEWAVDKSDDESRGFKWPNITSSSRWMLIHDLGHLKLYRMLKHL